MHPSCTRHVHNLDDLDGWYKMDSMSVPMYAPIWSNSTILPTCRSFRAICPLTDLPRHRKPLLGSLLCPGEAVKPIRAVSSHRPMTASGRGLGAYPQDGRIHPGFSRCTQKVKHARLNALRDLPLYWRTRARGSQLWDWSGPQVRGVTAKLPMLLVDEKQDAASEIWNGLENKRAGGARKAFSDFGMFILITHSSTDIIRAEAPDVKKEFEKSFHPFGGGGSLR